METMLVECPRCKSPQPWTSFLRSYLKANGISGFCRACRQLQLIRGGAPDSLLKVREKR
jgi:hypothetical protein